jgi:hypothetical protein
MIRRRYGVWSGNPFGHREVTTDCLVEVPGKGNWGMTDAHQCTKKRGYGPNGTLCKQHAKLLEEGKPGYVPEPTPTPKRQSVGPGRPL